MLAHKVVLRYRICVPASRKNALGFPARCGVEGCRTATVVEMKTGVHRMLCRLGRMRANNQKRSRYAFLQQSWSHGDGTARCLNSELMRWH